MPDGVGFVSASAGGLYVCGFVPIFLSIIYLRSGACRRHCDSGEQKHGYELAATDVHIHPEK